MRFRPFSSGSAETSALTPCETEVVTATSSARAWRRPAMLERNVSFRSTQKSHSAPFSSQPASQPSTACADAVREGALRARVQVRRGLEDRELAANGGADPRFRLDGLRGRHG